MVLLDKLWDDVAGGPTPEQGLGRLRKVIARPLKLKDGGGDSSNTFQRSISMPLTPGTPTTPTTPTTPGTSRPKDNVWRSVFNPGSNLATKTIGADKFDKPEPNSPTIYDWLYSGNSRSTYR